MSRRGIETFTQAFIGFMERWNIEADMVCASDFSNTYNLRHEFLGKVYAAGRSLLSLPSDGYEFVISNGYYGGGYFPKNLKTFTIFHSTHAAYAEAIRGLVPLSTYLEIRFIVGELFEQTAAFGSRIIAVSNSVKSELERYYGLKEVEVISNPVDTDFFFRLLDKEELRTKHGIPPDKKVGLFVGRWETSKGRDLAERVIRELKNLSWVIVTSSGGESFSFSDEKTFTFSGLDRTQMRELYCLSDFMLFPSRYEGFGLAAAEAMACGLPIIGTPVGFLAEAYSEAPFSAFSLPVSSLDGDDIVVTVKDRIDRLLNDKDFYEEISRKSRERNRGKLQSGDLAGPHEGDIMSELSDIRYELPDVKRALVFSPHPDDETLGCGGTIALYADKIDFTVVALSNGEAVDIPEDNKGELRKKELADAVKILGVRDIIFLNLPDGRFEENSDQIQKKISEICSRKDPELIFAPSPIDSHPDHRETAKACIELTKTFPSAENRLLRGIQPAPVQHTYRFQRKVGG